MKKLVSLFCAVALLFFVVVPMPVWAANQIVELSVMADGHLLTSSSTCQLFYDSSVSFDSIQGLDFSQISTFSSFSGVSHFSLYGFSPDHSYNGLVMMNMALPYMANGSVSVYVAGLVPLPYSYTVNGVYWRYFAPSVYVDVADVSARLPDGSALATRSYDSGLISIVLDDAYFSSANFYISLDVTYRATVVCEKKFGTASLSDRDFLMYYSFPYNYRQTYFTGEVLDGYNLVEDKTADLINKNNNKISEAEMSQAADLHKDLVDGFNDSAGQDANKNLQEGIASYESEESQAHQDFTSKMDSYENPDISDYVSGVSFISSAVVMWWNALGMFKIILLVGFSLMIFNFISRFRGG